MSEFAVKAEGLSKCYVLGKNPTALPGSNFQNYNRLSDTMVRNARIIAKKFQGVLRGKEKVFPTKDTPSNEFWALNDVSFEIPQNGSVGIIGRNGAGKSTLLKVLSRITEPSRGRVTLRGRVASLLEVGTGFHPELTGRENIYLNGAILGMTRREIEKKFTDIVDFAEVSKFLETPVKRYSSGMYVRLAFAVAAHLDPEVLIVDEVLAVGDVAFQKKCLGKMNDVAKSGRAVLFVSHNMQAIARLTTTSLLMDSGRLVAQGPTSEVIAIYNSNVFGDTTMGQPYRVMKAKDHPHIKFAAVNTSNEFGEQICEAPLQMQFEISVMGEVGELCLSVQVCDESGTPVCLFWLLDRGDAFRQGDGTYHATCQVPNLRLYAGRYTLTTWLADRQSGELLEKLSEICAFEVTMRGHLRPNYDWNPGEMVYKEGFEWQPIVFTP